MYIPHEKLSAEVKRLVALDLVSRLEVENALESYVVLHARVVAVSTIIANMRDEFRNQGKYSWSVRDFSINLADENPRKGMEHLRNLAVRVRLVAYRENYEYEDVLVHMGRGGHIDDNSILRTVEFPVSYLTDEDWLENAKRDAARQELIMLKIHAKDAPSVLARAEAELEATRERIAASEARIKEIEASGIIVEI